ncbi:DUF1573 domain-containing protein [Marinilabiliaceae bacterium JC017]|nr:DUF1573 domain-containing protein [Marinilabiliaceae bacterium JC017]
MIIPRVVYLVFILSLEMAACSSISTKDNAESDLRGNPVLVFDEELYTFGKVKYGDVVGIQLKYRNAGDGPLVIHEIKTSCGCLDVKFKNAPVEAGDSARIEVIFDTSGFQGRQVKMLKFFTNASEKPKEIVLWADINDQ